MADLKVYTLEEVCDILKVTKRTVYSYIKAAKLHAVKMGKYWRVSEENLKAFIETGTPVLNENRRKENQTD